MSDSVHVIELLPAYALGILEPEEAARVAEHLVGCASCRAELRSFQAVTDQLGLAAPEVMPPAELKRQILGLLQTSAPAPEEEPRHSWWQQLAGWFQQGAPAWGIASLILVVALVITNLWWWQQQMQPEQDFVTHGGMQVVAMAGTEAAPEATGTLVISEDGEYGTLIVDGLPSLGEDSTYQLWLIRDGQRTSGGLFSVNPEGYGALWISSPEPLSSYSAFGITLEPAGGSAGPTGDKVLGTSL
jgi:anti-sigma-K factor RskA